jgi:hypothetical protein
LTIFIDGQPRQVPSAIGIPEPVPDSTGFVTEGACFYGLHTHANDGLIHVESPSKQTYTLGSFFDVWGQPLSSNQIGPVTGRVTAFYNGKLVKGTDPRVLPLDRHAEIQLEVGHPLVSPQMIDFGGL